MTDAKTKWQEKWGGFVHPHPVLNTKDGGAYYDATPGMTLRDWFAGQAISGIIFATSSGLHTPAKKHGTTVVTGMAIDAYELADAMLSARSAK